MKKIFLLIMVAAILLSGCVDRTVKTGDNISVDYTGRLVDGKVFDTSIEKVAEENNLPPHGEAYKPLNFTVGKGQMIQGFDEGVIGMKVGETKKLTIPPEKAYPINPNLIRISPIIIVLPATQTMPKVIEVPKETFEQIFGMNHSVGDIVQIPDSNMNVTIINITSKISLSYNLKNGSNTWEAKIPWNQTVVKIDDKNITLKPKVTKNEIFDIPNSPISITIVDIDETNITIKYNPIPDTTVDLPGMFGEKVPTKISFNETSMIMDQNREVAGKTLIFNVTLVSIDK